MNSSRLSKSWAVAWSVQVVLVMLATSDCDGEPQGDRGSSDSPPQAVTEWLREGDRWCEYYRIGESKVRGLRCARQVQDRPQPVFDIYIPPNASSPSYQQAFPPGLEEYVFQYWPGTGQWTRKLASGQGSVDYCYMSSGGGACEWVSAAVYTRLLAEATQANELSAAEATRQQQDADRAAEEARENSQRFLREAQQRQIELGRIWTAPDCVHSTNGCWP